MTKSVAQGLAAYASDQDLRAAKVRMGEAMPDDGWLHDYLRAVTPLTDAPVEFHLVSGLCALAAAIGNRMWTVSWGQSVYPHLWAVLVAPSSFWRKSTSINQAEALLREACPTAVYPSDFSREKFLSILAETPAGVLTLKEFGGFLATLGRDYMGGMKENLTELYDGPDVFTRALKTAGSSIEIKRPAITLLGATTLDWLESRITEGDLQGGFLARFLFVTASHKASAKGLTGGMDYLVRMKLRDSLHEIHELPEAPAEIEPDAREMLDEWMHGWEAEVGRTRHRSDLSGFAVRLQTYALKLAMLYRVSASAFAEDMSAHVIDVRSVTQAIAYCRVLWSSVAILIDDDIAVTKDAKELRRIRRIIGDGITRSDALKLSKVKARDFDQYLDSLIQGGEIASVKVRASEVGVDRMRDTQLQWLAPVSKNGHEPGAPTVPRFPADAVPGNSKRTTGEPEEGVNDSEPEGPDPSTNDPSSSTSLSLSTDESHVDSSRAHARGNGKRKAAPAVDGDEARSSEDLPL